VEVVTRTISAPWDRAQEKSDQVSAFADLPMQVTTNKSSRRAA
jgi:hypothetical protein